MDEVKEQNIIMENRVRCGKCCYCCEYGGGFGDKFSGVCEKLGITIWATWVCDSWCLDTGLEEGG